jgi:hypothetical protein
MAGKPKSSSTPKSAGTAQASASTAQSSAASTKDSLNKFKMEAASEVGVNLKQGYNGDLTSKQAGSVGGQMVKKMIQAYEDSMR